MLLLLLQVLLYVHTDHKIIRGGELRAAASAFTQLLVM